MKFFEIGNFKRDIIITVQAPKRIPSEVNKGQYYDLIISQFIGRMLQERHSLSQSAAIWIDSGHLLLMAHKSKLIIRINMLFDL